MALLIERIQEMDVFYIRVQCNINMFGNKLRIFGVPFLDKEEYKRRIVASLPEFPKFVVGDYIRETDGPDMLMRSHQILSEYLSSEHTIIKFVQDPSTGEFEQVEQFIPRFCLPGEITIVDLG